LETTTEEYNLGTKSITDLIDAESEVLNANVEYFNANKNYLLNYFNLLALDGSLIKLFEEYLPKSN
jgi:Outer membrane protein